MQISYSYFDQLGLLMRQLATTQFVSGKMQGFTEKLLTMADGEKSPRIEKARGEIVDLFKRGTGNRGKTRWDALNAVTEYVDHRRIYGKTRLGSKGETVSPARSSAVALT